MAQPIFSTGYDGTVTEVDWASLSPATSSRPSVITGVTASVVGNVDRTIRIPAGQLYGWGVLDTITGNVDLTADAVTSGSRWDTVVLRRDWQPTPGGGSTLMILKGTSTKAVSSLMQSNPGVVADQFLYLIRVQAGLTTIQELIDFREWQTSLGFQFGTVLPNPARYNYGDKIIQTVGSALDMGVRRGGTGTETWDMLLGRDWANISMASGYQTFSGDIPRWRVVGDMLQLRGRFERTSHGAFNNSFTTVGSVPLSLAVEHYTSIGSSFSSTTGGGGQCNIQTNGVIQVIFPDSLVTWASFSGISVPIGA